MAQDIVEILPFEIWERCIAEACQGENYMANLLTLTKVSAKWCQFMMETPTLWATIHLNDADEDSIATIAVFLQLSGEVQLSLRIWVPLPNTWKTVCSMLLRQSRQIREVILQTDSQSHLAECSFQSAISDAQLCDILETILKTLNHPASIRYIDVDLNRAVKIKSIWVPANLVSMGNWLVPWSIIKPHGTFPRLRHLSISAVDLPHLLPHFSALGHLRHLYLHSGEQDYIQPPPPPTSSITASLSLPFLDTLQYHGRFYLAPTQLLHATSQTIQNIYLCIGLLDLNVAVRSLEVCHSLCRLSLTLLMLEYDLNSSNSRRLYLLMSITSLLSKMNIPNWRLERVEDFKCEMKTLGGGQIPQKLNVDHLWYLFHTIFPNLEALVWNVPIQSNRVATSLIKQRGLRRFESHTVPESPYGLLSGAHPTLESLHIRDVRVFGGMFIANLLHLSVTFQEESRSFEGVTFGLLQSLNLKIGESIKKPWNLQPTNFPALKVLSITFLGPRNGFKLPDLPSLTEITISTLSPTHTQGMDFCASLACEPRKFPRLEQINLDSVLEWDILCLLLQKRNVLQKGSVSRIKRLRLPFMPPKLRPVFGSLLAGRDVLPFPFSWIIMTRLGIQGSQSRLLDPQIMGCFCCVQLGPTDCNEPLQPSRLPEKYRNRTGNHNITDVVEFLDLFPIYNWDITQPLLQIRPDYGDIWMMKHEERAEEWRNAACEWSKLHHRTLICHKQLCSPKIMVTEYDAESEDTSPDMPSLAIQSLSNYDQVPPNSTDLAKAGLRDAVELTIPSLIKLIIDEEYHIRSAATFALAKLAVHAKPEPRDASRAAIPPLIKLLEAVYDNTRSAATSALATLAIHAELRDVLEPAIPSLIKLLVDEYHLVRSAATSALVQLIVHAELRDAIEPAIPSFIGLLADDYYHVRSAAVSALGKLAVHAELRDAIEPAIPSFIGLLADEYYLVRSAAASALPELAVDAKFHDAIEPAIPSLIKLLVDENYSIQPAATSALAKLAVHGELRVAVAVKYLIKAKAQFCDAILVATPFLVGLLRSNRSGDAAASALAELASHTGFSDAIRPAIPSLIGQLQEREKRVRFTAISMLGTLAQDNELCDMIRPAIPLLMDLFENGDSDIKLAAATALAQLLPSAQ